ncbi:element excision factor XisI family protein [Nostoc sp.]|uniref:element excision factor XisI family protein n=1 Tax=Nostoc sp. TaxID=1180 RepID=UPI002FFD51A1
MDKLTQYEKIIQQVLEEYAAIASQDPEIETQLVFDTAVFMYLKHICRKGTALLCPYPRGLFT